MLDRIRLTEPEKRSVVRIINNSNNPLPQYETAQSAGMDLRAHGTYVVSPNGRKLIQTGLRFELPQGIEAQIRPRSGLALNHGITVLNSPGTIDADYRGDVGVILYNTTNVPFVVNPGDRIAQVVFNKVESVQLDEVLLLTETTRGEGGFGSTGLV